MSGSESEQFCLKWNDFQQCIRGTFQELRDQPDFMDVTLSCDGEQVRAHKVILSACSVTFRQLLKANPAPNPVILLWDVSLRDLASILDFMYNGEVNVKQEHLNSFLAVAERLRVRGLSQNDGRSTQNDSGGGGGVGGRSAKTAANRHHSVAAESPVTSVAASEKAAGGSSSSGGNSSHSHHSNASNNSAKRLKYDPTAMGAADRDIVQPSQHSDDSSSPAAAAVVKQERVEDIAAAVGSISQLAARFSAAAAAAHAAAAANAASAVAAAAGAGPPGQQIMVAGSAEYSDAYGEGDYEEGYYDEDVGYNAGDAASAGKGDRSAGARQLGAAAAAAARGQTERSSRSESPLSLSASPKLEIITGMANVLSMGSLSPSMRDSMRQRTVYSPAQILELEKEFQFSHFLTGERRSALAQQLRLTDRQVKIWFQNRRMKLKKEVKEGRIGFGPQL